MVEIPPTRDRGEAQFVAPRFPLARGWLRQLESGDFELFDGGGLTASAYHRWLGERGVAYVAVSGAQLDYLAEDEVALINSGLPYLHAVWSNGDWRLYRVRGARGLASRVDSRPPYARPADPVDALGPASFALRVRRRGRFLVRIHYTPYWSVTAGDACVERDGAWTAVDVRRPGRVELSARFSLAGLLRRDRACSG
jgi:hypothetical protein